MVRHASLFFLQCMEHRFHMIKCCEFRKADFIFEDGVGIFDMICQILCAVGIGTDRDDLTAEVFIQLQDLSGWLCIG